MGPLHPLKGDEVIGVPALPLRESDLARTHPFFSVANCSALFLPIKSFHFVQESQLPSTWDAPLSVIRSLIYSVKFWFLMGPCSSPQLLPSGSVGAQAPVI